MATLALGLPKARVESEYALLLLKLRIEALVQGCECFNKWWIHVWNGKEIKSNRIDSVDCGPYIRKEESKTRIGSPLRKCHRPGSRWSQSETEDYLDAAA